MLSHPGKAELSPTRKGNDPATELQALLDAAADGIVIIDHRGHIETFNRAAERLFGYEQGELVGRNVNVLMTDDDREAHDGYLARYHRTGVPHIIGVGREVTARRRDGTTFPISLSVGRIGRADPPRFVGFLHDMTLRQQALIAAERERDWTRAAQERLTQVSRLATLGEMIAGIAHELNQPLAAITTYAQGSQHLLDLEPPDINEVQDALGEIASQALRAAEVIRRLRRLARGQETRRESCDLNEVIRELETLIETEARLHDVRITFDLTPEPLEIYADRVQVQQVLLNLLRNATEALASETTDRRDVTIRTRLLTDGHIEATVCDNGPGVDPKIADRMFDPFRTTKASSTGLGLSVSRTIIEAHGGKLEYVPDRPRGASFRIRLPSAEGAAG
jgi:two-component system, LuxR family, sensor kinase FixL